MSLVNAGVEPLVLTGEVEAPVLLEVPVADDGAEGEDGLGAVQAPSGPSDVETVGYEVAACSLDDAGRDRPAGVEGLVVAQELALVPQVADARVGAGAPAAFQSGGIGFGGDLGGGPVAVAGQDREGLDRDPVLGGGVPGLVEAPGGAPEIFKTWIMSIMTWM